jgi:hypothetical protein
MMTFTAIKAAQVKAQKTKKDVYITDDPGKRLGWRLGLRCMPSGSATWLFRYTHNGKRDKPITLGHLEKLDILSARRAASELADIYKETSDVSGRLQAEQRTRQIAINDKQLRIMLDEQSKQALGCYTLARLMAVYVAYLQRCGRSRSAGDVVSLSKNLAPISSKPAAAVSTRDLATIQRKLIEAGKGRTANKLRSYVRAAYALVLRAESDATSPAEALNFVIIGRVEANPAALLAVAKGFNCTVDRVLTDKELYLLLEHAKDAGVVGLAVRAAVFLGGQRMSQLLRVSSKSIQDDFLVLLDPKGKRDTPRRHPIPLEGIAGTLINEAKNRANTLGTNLLFSSTGKVQLHPDTVSKYVAIKSKEFIQSGMSATPFTLADLRRTVETRLAGKGVTREVRGYLQSHGLSGVQVRHYERHDYEKEKRAALRLLHKWIKSLDEQKNKSRTSKQVTAAKW